MCRRRLLEAAPRYQVEPNDQSIDVRDEPFGLSAQTWQPAQALLDARFGLNELHSTAHELRKFSLCRICFRKFALAGEIPGVTKASW